MKLIACDICQGIETLSREKIKSCKCGAISGKYLSDGRYVEIMTKNKKETRVLGLQNSVRFAAKESGEAWIIPWSNPTIKIKKQ